MATIINHPSIISWGLHGIDCNTVTTKKFKEWDKGSANTIMNVIGWIPIIGAIIGALRICMGVEVYRDEIAKQNPNQDNMNLAKVLIGRGIAEVLCCGPLLALADIIITIARTCIENDNQAKAGLNKK